MVFSGRELPILGIDAIVGPCIRTLPIRQRIQHHQSVTKNLCSAQLAIDQAQEHGNAGLQAIGHATNLDARSLTSTLVNFYGYRMASAPSREAFSVVAADDRVDNQVSLSAWTSKGPSQSETVLMHVQVGGDHLLTEGTAHWLGRRVCHYIEILGQHAELRLDSAIRSQSAYAAAMLTSFSNTQDHRSAVASLPRRCIHELFEEQVARTPEKIALQYERAACVTYRELNERVTAASKRLRWLLYGDQAGCCFCKQAPSDAGDAAAADVGMGGQQLVPICYDKGVDMVVAILAVLKAGACFVPLDPAHPAEWLKAIVEQTNAKIILWSGSGEQFGDLQDDGLEVRLQQAGASTGACLGTLASIEEGARPSDDRGSSLECDPLAHHRSLAYVLFTSGSTGVPKGVMVEHRNLVSFVRARMGNAVGVRMQLAAYTFDVSIGDFFAVLTAGGRLGLVRRHTMLSALSFWLDAVHASHLALTPSVGDLLVETTLPSQLHTMMFGGEAFHRGFLERIPRDCTVWNTCGPTETVVDAMCCTLQTSSTAFDASLGYVPLGKPFGRCAIYILRPDTLELAPIGAVGEICIGGPQVSRGYLGMPELTASKFVVDPFVPRSEPGDAARMFRTADLGRMHGDGTIEYLGRMDGQVKLRGLRIETGEIETAILQHSAIAACSVIKFSRARGPDELLLAFVVPRDSHKAVAEADWEHTEANLTAGLEAHLPD